MERLTQIDPHLCEGRPFVVQKFVRDEIEVPEPSIISIYGDEGRIIYGDIIDRLAFHEDKWYIPTTIAAQPVERMTRERILDAAKRCVCGDREQDYGKPEQNFQTIANLWIDYLQGKDDPLDIQPEDVAAMLSLLKIARIASGHGKADNWVDLAGYAACGGELEGAHE